MNTKRTVCRRRVILGLCLAALAVVESAGAASTITKTDDTVIAVRDVQWRESDQCYYVIKPDGTSFQVPRADVQRTDIDKPQAFTLAEDQVAQNKLDLAIASLDGVISKYKMLGWDIRARALTAEIHMRKNESRKAKMVLDPVFAMKPRPEIEPETYATYWNALLSLGAESVQTLKKELDEAIATGTRDAAGAAYVVRGSMNRMNGQREAALLDYLRVVVMFENVKGVHAEALYNAALVLDDMRDARGDELRRKLVALHPDDPYAVKAKGKLGQ